jgi:hypothetical protein
LLIGGVAATDSGEVEDDEQLELNEPVPIDPGPEVPVEPEPEVPVEPEPEVPVEPEPEPEQPIIASALVKVIKSLPKQSRREIFESLKGSIN